MEKQHGAPMKTWTVVLEIIDHADRTGPSAEEEISRNQIIDMAQSGLENRPGISFRIMETIEAPYGPQHPDGVFIVDGGSQHLPRRH